MVPFQSVHVALQILLDFEPGLPESVVSWNPHLLWNMAREIVIFPSPYYYGSEHRFWTRFHAWE